jgi:NADH-quinone oxidoreductase subunit K
MDVFSMVTLADGWASRLSELAGFRLTACLALAAMLFAVGAWGVLARRNILVMLISVEVMLNAVMLAFAAFARAHVNLGAATGQPLAGESGQIFGLFIIAVAAAEAAVGLAIVVSYFRLRETVDTRDMTDLKE